MIARLLFLVAALGSLIVWLAWSPAPEAPRTVDADVPAAAGDFDPLRPVEPAPAAPSRAAGKGAAAAPGRAGAERAEGSLVVRLPGTSPDSRWMVHVEEIRSGGRAPLALPALDGVARAESLPLGGNFEVLAVDEDARAPTRRARVEGPRAPGDRVEIVLPAPEPVHVLTRVVDPTGAPITDTPVEWLVVHGDHARGEQTWVAGRTNATGELVAVLGHPEGASTRRALWVRTSAAGGARHGGKVDLHAPLARGEHAVAPVVIEPEPLLVRGRVLDAEGRPTGRRGLVTALVFDEDGRARGANPPLVGRFGKDGAFAIHGFASSSELVLRATAGDEPGALVPEGDVRVRPGSTDAVVRLVAPGVVLGVLRVDAVTPPYELRVHVSPEGRDEVRTVSPAADGSFRAEGLAPGLYRVRVTTVDDERNALVDVHDVVVTAGETTRDARLARVDLRNRVRRVELVFDRATNLVPHEGRCRLTRRDTGTTWERPFHGPTFRLTLSEASYDLDVQYGNFAPVRLIDVRGDQHLPLRRGRALVLRLVDPENLPPASVALVRVRLRPDGDDGDLPEREVWLSETRTRVANVPPGRWRVQLDVVRRDGGPDEPASPVHAGTDPLVEVPAEGDVEFALDLDEVALIEALARLGD